MMGICLTQVAPICSTRGMVEEYPRNTDRLTGRVEVDECYVGGLEEGLPGRLNLDKALVVVAAQEDGPGIGRIRMRQIIDASAESLVPFVQDSVEPGSIIHTDGWLGYLPLQKKGYEHQVTSCAAKRRLLRNYCRESTGPSRSSSGG